MEAASTLEAVAQLLSEPESVADEAGQPDPVKEPLIEAIEQVQAENAQAVGAGIPEPSAKPEAEPGEAAKEASPEQEAAGDASKEGQKEKEEPEAVEGEDAKEGEQESASEEVPVAGKEAEPSAGAELKVREAQEQVVQEGGQKDGAPESLQDHFELFRKKKEAEAKCESLIRDIRHIESNADLLELLKAQQKQSYSGILSDLIKKDAAAIAGSLREPRTLAQALAERRPGASGVSESSEVLKLLRDAQQMG